MLVSDVRTRVYDTFGDTANVQINDALVLRWINDAQRQIALNNEMVLPTSAVSNTVANTASYALPADFNVLKSVHLKANPADLSYFRMEYLSPQQMDEYLEGWDGTMFGSTRPQVYTRYGNNITVFPTPDLSVTNGLKLFYGRVAADRVNASDVIDLPSLYHEAVVTYCLMQAYLLDEDPNFYTIMKTKFDEDNNKKKDDEIKGGIEYYPTITVRAEDEDIWGWG